MPSQDVSIARYFADLPDPRVDRTKKHSLGDILVIALCAVVSQATGCQRPPGPVTIGLPALLTLSRWCRQQLASPRGGAPGPAAAPDQCPPPPPTPAGPIPPPVNPIGATLPADRRQEIARVLAVAVGRRRLPSPTEGRDDPR